MFYHFVKMKQGISICVNRLFQLGCMRNPFSELQTVFPYMYFKFHGRKLFLKKYKTIFICFLIFLLSLNIT